jgi:hypothetical protein
LCIFDRDAWQPEGETGRSTLRIRLMRPSAWVRLMALWPAPASAGPADLAVAFRGGAGELSSVVLHPFGNHLFSRWQRPESGAEALLLSAAAPPHRLELAEVEGAGFAATPEVLPACLAAPAAPAGAGARGRGDLVPLVAEALRRDGLSGALAVFGSSRSGASAGEVLAAARAILTHLEKFPLERDPLLGAFLASLGTEALVQ